MKKSELFEYLGEVLEPDKNYSYLVLDLRPWKKGTPDLYQSWIPEKTEVKTK